MAGSGERGDGWWEGGLGRGEKGGEWEDVG